MALRKLIVSHEQAIAMRIIYFALMDKSGRHFADVLRDMIASALTSRSGQIAEKSEGL